MRSLPARDGGKLKSDKPDLANQSTLEPRARTVSNEKDSTLARLQEELESVRHCIDVCSKLEKSLEEDIVMYLKDVNTTLTTADNRATSRTRGSTAGLRYHIGGHLSDDSVRQAADMLSINAVQNMEHILSPVAGNAMTETADLEFWKRYGPGVNLKAESTPVLAIPSERPTEGSHPGDFSIQILPRAIGNYSLDIGLPHDKLERNLAESQSPNRPDGAIEFMDRDYENQKGHLSDSVSEPDTIFSKSHTVCSTESSVSTLGFTALDELVGLLLNHGTLRPLYETAVKNVATEKFQRHLHGFINDYGEKLQQEAKTPEQMAVSKFVYRRASKVASKISRSMQETRKPPRNHSAVRYEESRRERLNTYLRELQADFATEPRVKGERETTEVEEPEEEEPPSLDRVKGFLTSTKAFENLCQSISDWLKLDAEVQADKVYIESEGHCRPRGESNVGRSLSPLARFISSISVFTLIYWRVTMASTKVLRAFWEPRIAPDMERLRWRCVSKFARDVLE